MRSASLYLLVGRLCEQGTIAGIGVLVARAATPSDYAPFAALLIFTSVSTAISDLGVGLEVLSNPRDRVSMKARAELLAVHGLVVFGVGVGVAAGAVGVATSVALALIWLGTSYSYVGKAVLIRDGRLVRHALAEVGGAVAACAVFLAAPAGESTSGGLAIGVMFAVEGVLSYRAHDVFSGSNPSRSRRLLFTQGAAFANANVDYLIAFLLLSRSSFSTYVLAFRLANAFNSQVGNVLKRLFLQRYASATAEERYEIYPTFSRLILVLSSLAAGVSFLALRVLERFLSGQWDGLAAVGLLVVVALPARTAIGVMGAMAVTHHREAFLARFELVLLVVGATVMAAGASAGLVWFVAAGSTVAVVACWWGHRLVAAEIGVPLPPSVAWATVVQLIVCSAAAVALAGTVV